MTTPLGADPHDLETVEGIVRAASTSFMRGMSVLPPDRRAAMFAIYAFCRIVDDIADEPGNPDDIAEALDIWRARIAGLYRGEADEEVSRVLRLAVQAYDLREADFLAVIDGMAMDAATAIVAPTRAELDLYCDRVAVAVGRLSVRAFGDASPQADIVAHHLGRALQLTNILRDIHEDSERGRLYLPAEYLDEAGIEHDPEAALENPNLPFVCTRLAHDARGHFRAASRAMRKCKPRAMKPARLMGATYAAILRSLERRGWTHLEEAVKLSFWSKIWIALRHMVA